MRANTANGHAKVPEFQKAMIYDNPGTISTRLERTKVPEPRPGEVLINLTHSGVCFSDLAVMTNAWGDINHGQVGGHEGVGTVVGFGSDTERYTLKLGDRVGVKWMSSICGTCMPCLTGLDGSCINGKISGFGTPGTFQQYVTAPAHYVTPIPDGLSSELAAPILCGGVTVYSALKKSGAQPGDWVVVSGAGGGLGHLAVQIGARVMSYRMIAIDADEKEDFCRSCGAEVFLSTTDISDTATSSGRIMKATSGIGAAAVVVCAASNDAYAQALSYLRIGGTLVCVGVPKEQLPIGGSSPGLLVNKQLKIVGSTVGNRKDACEIAEMAARGLVIPNVKVETMERLSSVFESMVRGNCMVGSSWILLRAWPKPEFERLELSWYPLMLTYSSSSVYRSHLLSRP